MTDSERARSTKRLGIYGGTFNPPHIGHVHAAREFLRAKELDSLLIMPASIPPHKQIDIGDSPEIRLEMCRAAFGDISDKLTVSDYEIKKGGVSYTSDTLLHYSSDGVKLYFLCGTDMFLSLERWHEPETIFSLAEIVCIMRENDDEAKRALEEQSEKLRSMYGAAVDVLRCDAVEMASADIRKTIASGNSADDAVPPEVMKIINNRGLYR